MATSKSLSELEEMLSKVTNAALSKAAANQSDAVAAWVARVSYCVERMDAEEFGKNFLHNIEVYLGIENTYQEISDRVVKDTQVVLLRELSPLIGLTEHRLFDVLDKQTSETLLPEGVWMLRRTRCNVRRNKNSYTFRITNDMSMTEKEMKARMMECVNLIK